MHLHLIIHQPQTRQRGRKLQLLQRVTDIAIKVPEHGLELLELDGRQVRHVARHQLVFQEGEFLADRGLHERELVGQLVVRVRREVVLFDVGFRAALVERGDGGEEGGERREVGVQALRVPELVGDVALEAGDGEREGVEGEGEVVGSVGYGGAVGFFYGVGMGLCWVVGGWVLGGGCLLSDRLIDHLTPVPFCFHQYRPLVIEHFQP